MDIKLHRSSQLRLFVRRWRSLCLYSLVEVKDKLFVRVHYRYNVGQGSAGSQLPARIGTQGLTLGARRLRQSHLCFVLFHRNLVQYEKLEQWNNNPFYWASHLSIFVFFLLLKRPPAVLKIHWQLDWNKGWDVLKKSQIPFWSVFGQSSLNQVSKLSVIPTPRVRVGFERSHELSQWKIAIQFWIELCFANRYRLLRFGSGNGAWQNSGKKKKYL